MRGYGGISICPLPMGTNGLKLGKGASI